MLLMGNGKKYVWGDSMVKRPEVSIICCTYNHERSIRDTLNNFLAQKTNFPVEILIYDDASTDNTVSIINEYAMDYPQIIKPIFQKENQHSKGIDIQQINYERSRGKYIAICDGDSFWIDEYKLQRQYDYLEKAKNCVLSVHAGKVVDADGKGVETISASKMSRFYVTSELVKGDSGLFVKNSMFFRAHVVKNRPPLFMNLPVKLENHLLILYLSLFGQVHFMRDVMSCSLVGTSDYWTATNGVSDETENFQEIGEWFLQFDEWTSYKFHDVIEAKLQANHFVTKEMDFKKKDAMSLQTVESMPLKRKVVELVERYVPQLAVMLKRKRWLYQLLYRRH